MGRAPRTKETLLDFLKWRRVTRQPLVFHGLTGSQRTPGFGASQYRIVERIGEVAYRLELPSDLDRIYDVFHVSMLRKYIPDPLHVLTEQPVEIQENLTYEEEPVLILDRREQVMRNKTIPLVKVLWRSHTVEEATWEHEVQMKRHYPHLFDAGTNVLISRTKFL